MALGLLIAAAAAAVAIVSGGWVSIGLGLVAGIILADALVPDFHTPLFENLPASGDACDGAESGCSPRRGMRRQRRSATRC